MQSGTLLAAPAVLDPTAFLLALTYCFACFRGGPSLQNPGPNPGHVGAMLAHFSVLAGSKVQKPYVGAMLALCWHIFHSGASFFRSWTPLARLLGVVFVTFDFIFVFWVAPGRIVGRPWSIWRLRLFVSPLQRAGTCEAHGIGSKCLRRA